MRFASVVESFNVGGVSFEVFIGPSRAIYSHRGSRPVGAGEFAELLKVGVAETILH
jgi:hypothetical protein